MARRTTSSRGVAVRLALVSLALCVCGIGVSEAQTPGRFLGREEITLYGLGLAVQPAQQTVPKGFATVVGTFLQTPQLPVTLPPFAADAEVRATLRGPSFERPIELTAKPNAPLNVPILTVPGTHTVENIRLVSGGDVLLYGSPQSVRIDVIEKLLVTSVTARALTAAEIREKGIVFDSSNYQAYNFTAAFAIEDGKRIDIAFPVVLPTLAAPTSVDVSSAGLALVDPPMLRDIGTIIPDTLQIQSRIPNLSVTGFSLTLASAAQSQDFYVPPIPGVVVIPGDIGFLNQYFSVMLLVANVAPAGSSLAVTDLSAAIVLPPGTDNVVGSQDDPLRMAQTAAGESPRVQPVRQAGPDGKLGTGDDVTTLGPGETGSAEYLIEGRREGTWPVEMAITGTLTGLPAGPVAIRGRAAGSVLVRNPTFTLTFTHPEIVNAGEPYTLDVTVTNTSEAPANLVSVNLFAQNISGARLAAGEDASKSIETIAPGDSAAVTFRLVSQRTGRVTAATLDSDENVAGRFALKTGVGEFGIPLSPDSLVLPKEAGALPSALREAALGLLGRAWAVATAPPAAFPKNLTRFSKQVVLDRAVEAAEAGFRVSLGEPLPMSAGNLLMDVLGSEYPRLASKVPASEKDPASLLALLQADVRGFDLLRRQSFRGDVFAQQIGAVLSPVAAAGGVALHRALAEQFTSRPGHLSVLVTGPAGGALPVDVVLVDPSGRRLGGSDGTKTVKEIPFGDVVDLVSGTTTVGRLFVVAVPDAGQFTGRLTRLGAPGATYSVSVAYPDVAGKLRFVSFENVGAAELPTIQHAGDDPVRVRFEFSGAETPAPRAAAPSAVHDPAPTVLGAVQMAEADIVGCKKADPPLTWHGGRVVAVLFSEQVTAASVQDKLAADKITAFSVPDNRVVGVALQPGGRIVYVALREPVGPFVERAIAVQGVTDTSGQVMAAAAQPVAMTVTTEGGVVAGQVLKADGTPAAGAELRLFYEYRCEGDPVVEGMASQFADAEGRYQFDYVVLPPTLKIVAVAPDTNDVRVVRFQVARNSQHLNVNVVFIGRGTFAGRTLAEDGTPLANSTVRVTSLTDQSQYAGTSDAQGRFEIQRVPVGNIVVEAVNTVHPSQVVISERVPVAGVTITRDLTLLSLDMTGVTMKTGRVTGRLMRSDGVTPVAGAPVVAYYANRSQAGVRCSPPPPPFDGGGEPGECAVAIVNSDGDGGFAFPSIAAGQLRLYAFDQAALQEGQVRVTLAENQVVTIALMLGGGFGTVQGVVIDQAGRPVADAQVGGGLSLTKVNPATGTFTLTDVPVGRREIVAASQGLGSTGRTTVDIVRQGETVSATIVLDVVGGVAGRVFDVAGVPQPGITVYVIQDCYDESGNDAVCVAGQATTDASGAYRVNGLRAGQYRASAFRADMKDGNIVSFAVRYQGQVVPQNITFRGGLGAVTGRVLRAKPAGCAPGDATCVETPLSARVAISGDQLVVGGGKVGVRFEYVQNFRIVDNDATTGAFAFSGLWAGRFTVRAAGQFSPEPVAVEGTIPGAGQSVNVDLRLQPTSTITGTVYEPDGVTPVTGRQVSLTFKSNAVVVFCHDDATTFESNCTTIPQGIQEMSVATNPATGEFSFPIVNAGAFTITATDASGGRVAETRGSVKAGETVDIGVRLLARGRVAVRVFRHDAHTPVTGASVRLQQIDYPKTELAGTATDGTIGWEPLGEGQFVVTAMDGNGFGGRAAGRVSRDGETVAVDVYLYDATGTVTGLVTRLDAAGTAVSVPNAEVVLNTAAGPIAFAVTDPAGQYSVSLVPVGGFTVDGFDPVTAGRGRASGSVAGGSQSIPADIRLEALGEVRGVVLESDTLTPLKGWQVELAQTTPQGRGLPTLVTTTSVDGSFAFPGATVGSYSLSATRRGVVGQGTANGSVTNPGQLVTVQVLASVVRRVTGRVTGLVAGAGGSPVASAQVEVCAADGCQATTAGTDGRFSIGDVVLGRFTVRATAQVTGAPSVGTSGGTLLFDGDTADVTVTLLALSTVEGTVYEVGGSGRTPSAGATVRLYGQPGSGCSGPCQQSADASGHFRFVNVPAQTFTISAATVTGTLRQGSVGGVLVPGETRSGLDVVLEPAVGLSGRVRLANGTAAAGIVAELTTAGSRLYAESGADGVFAFDAVKSGAYTLVLQDPVGAGIARKTGTVDASAPVQLGDLTLDETPPAVATITPADGSVGVALAPELRITFTEPINRATVTSESIVLAGPSGPVTGELVVPDGTNDSVVVFRLLGASQLVSQSRYSLRVSGVEDRLGKKMVGQTSATFTTIDTTPPSVVETSPTAAATGVSIDSVVRVKFSEIVDTARFSGPAITVNGPSGPVAGTVDLILAGTVAVFTPARPLAEDSTYVVSIQKATDLGGLQSSASSFSFSTTDRTAPQVTALVASNGGHVTENTVATVTATVSAGDVAFVDFFINDVHIDTDRAAPFAMAFQALPAYGAAGSSIKVSAVATDTSGNRGAVVSANVAVDADAAPAASITAPSPGATVTNNQTVSVTVRGTDDVGVARVGYKATMGSAVLGALSRTVTPAPTATSSFTFTVPADAAPGTAIVVDASVADTAGHVGAAAPVTLSVIDTTGPAVSITSPTNGAIVPVGQAVTVVVGAQDQGGVARVSFQAVGAAGLVSRPVSPPQKSVVTSFTFTVPNGAAAGSIIEVRAGAADAAGNQTSAGSVNLVVADAEKPAAAIRTATGTGDMYRGVPVSVVVSATDNIRLATLSLVGTGAFPYSASVPVDATSASHTFTLDVPANLADGATEVLTAQATDWSGNQSAAVALTLTARSIVDVALPPSVLLDAGTEKTIVVALGAAASRPVTVQLRSSAPSVATVTPSITIPAGTLEGTATVTGIGGGDARIEAYVSNVLRASGTVTVRGGVVHGTVVDANQAPVGNADVTIFHGGSPIATTSGADGTFEVSGVVGFGGDRAFTVQASKDDLLGRDDAELSVPGGSATVTVMVLPLSIVQGAVLLPGGTTPAGAGVQVDLREASQMSVVLHTVWTDAQGHYEFRLVAPGSYAIDASDASGNWGRGTAAVVGGGHQVTANVTFLGKGTVTGLVKSGSGAPAAYATVELGSSSAHGQATLTSTAGSDGRFEFDGVFVGTFTVTARDPNSHQAGTVSGAIAAPGQTADVTVTLSSFGNIEGTVYRSDGTTVVPGASVSVAIAGSSYATSADADGRYSFSFLPYAQTFTVSVSDAATGAKGKAAGSFTGPNTTATTNVVLMAQGTLILTVLDSNGSAVNGASAQVTVTNGGITDSVSGQTARVNDVDGQLVITNLMAGDFTASASKSGLSGSVTGQVVKDTQVAATIHLAPPPPSGSIVGTVFLPDGVSPAGGSVRAMGTPGTFTASIQADGSFALIGVLLGSYRLEAFDAGGRLRAFTSGVVLSTPDQQETRTLTFVGFGTVSGLVSNPITGVSNGVHVAVMSSNPDFGGYFQTTTGAGGEYAIAGVPVGAFHVSAESGDSRADGAGTIRFHEDAASVNLTLEANTFAGAVSLWDGNDSPYGLDASGVGLSGGTGSVFRSGAALLDLVRPADGATARFGAPYGTWELADRQAVSRVADVFGLAVTRKFFVPEGGYFARVLETLRNQTDAPVTVDVKVTSNLWAQAQQYGGQPIHFPQKTSSGDAALDVGPSPQHDHWVVMDDANEEVDPYYSPAGHGTPVAFVFDGPGAARLVGAATSSTEDPYQAGPLTYTWQAVTIQPGETVTFMHFVAQQSDQAAAVASAGRLVQLPPEAIAGLTAFELATIANFVVPSDGVGSVEALPAITGSVSGHVFEGDGSTPVPSSPVSFRSALPVHRRTWRATSGADGAFAFVGDARHAVPLTAFELAATHPVTGRNSGPAAGELSPTAPLVTRDIVFGTTGALKGVVRRHTGAVVTTGTVYVTLGDTSVASGNLFGDGSYLIGGIPATTVTPYAISVVLPAHEQGTPPQSVAATQVIVAGQTATLDLAIEPTGTLDIALVDQTGSPVPGRTVTWTRGDTFRRVATTNDAGHIISTDMPVGTFVLTTSTPVSGFPVTATATVAQDVTSAATLAYQVPGTLTVRVLRANGQPKSGVRLTVHGDGFNIPEVVTDAAGAAVVSGVPVGVAATVDAVYKMAGDYDGYGYRIAASGSTTLLDSQGGVGSVVVTLPPFGAIVGTVSLPSGAPARDSAHVTIPALDRSRLASATDSSYVFDAIPTGRTFTLRTYRNDRSGWLEATARIVADGETVVLDTRVPAFATLRVSVKDASNAPRSGVYVSLTNTAHDRCTDPQKDRTNASGLVTLPAVNEGTYDLTVFASSVGCGGQPAALERAFGTINASDDGATIDVPIVIQSYTVDVTGKVTFADGTSPVGDWKVQVMRAADLVGSEVTTAADGSFSVSHMAVTGAGVLFRMTSSPGGTSVPDLRVTDGLAQGLVRATIVTPAYQATVSGRLLASDGTTPIGGEVALDVLTTDYNYLGWSAATQGAFTFGPMALPAAGARVRVQMSGVPSGYFDTLTGPFTANNETRHLDLVVPDSVYATVRGTVVAAGDGRTPVAGAPVHLLAKPSGDDWLETTTDDRGRYEFVGALPAGGTTAAGFTVLAYSPVTGTVTARLDGQATVQTGVVDLGALPMPISVLTGLVRYTDGEVVPNPSVWLPAQDGSTQFAYRTREDGSFAFYELPPGAYHLIAQDTTSGLQSSVETAVADATTVAETNVAMPPTGTLTVAVVDGDGAPLKDAEVAIVSASVAFERLGGPESYYSLHPTADGRYIVTHVPLGGVYVQGTRNVCNPDCTTFYTSAEATVPAEGASVSSTLAFGGYATVTVQVVDARGKPVTDVGREVHLTASGGEGPLGQFQGSQWREAGDTSEIVFDNVPAGVVQAWLSDSSDPWSGPVGEAEATVASGQAATIGVAFGNGFNFGSYYSMPAEMTGGAFIYPVTSDGLVDWVRATDGTLSGTIVRSGVLTVGGSEFGRRPMAGLELDGRQLVLGPAPAGSQVPLDVRRRIYVPSSGGFVRYLDQISNPTGLAVTTAVKWTSSFPNGTTPEVVQPSAVAGGRIVVPGIAGSQGTSAFIVSGAGAPVVPSPFSMDGMSYSGELFSYTWDVTIPPHGTVGILQFLVADLPDAFDAVRARAERLQALSEPGALEGLTESQLATVVNFRSIGHVLATVHGTALTSDGSVGLGPGYRVELLSPGGERLAETTTDADSAYSFGPIEVSGIGARVRVYVPGLPGGYVEATTGIVSTPGQTVETNVPLPSGFLVFTRGIVSTVDAAFGNGAGHRVGVEGAVVKVLDAVTGAELYRLTTNRDGFFSTAVSVPAHGRFLLRAESPSGSGTRAEVAFTATEQHQTLVDDDHLVLPVTFMTGSLFDADGHGVPYPTVFAVRHDGLAVPATATHADGGFVIIDAPPGRYRTVGQDAGTGLTVELGRVVTLSETTSHEIYMDMGLPPTGTVEVRPTDEGGQAVADATVALVSDNLAFERRVGPSEVVKPEGGVYTFTGVPVGPFALQGKRVRGDQPESSRDLFASGGGTLASATEIRQAPLAFAGYGQVLVNVVYPTTGPLLIRLDALGASGPLGAYTFAVEGSATSFAFDLVPPGPVRASMRQDGDVGAMEGGVESGASSTIDLYKNNAWDVSKAPATVDDSRGFRHGFGANGALQAGGTTDGALSETFANGPALYVGNDEVCCVAAARWELDWRQLVFGPMAVSSRGLWAIRRAYVSPATEGHGFVRFLDTVGNPTAVPVTVTIGLRMPVTGAGTGARTLARLVQPGMTTPGYAVVTGSEGRYAASAYAFSSANPGAVPSNVSFDFSRTDVARCEWTVTIPPHASVALLHFVVQAADAEAAEAAAADLANQVEYMPLVGLSEAELSAVLNFRVPAPGAGEAANGPVDVGPSVLTGDVDWAAVPFLARTTGEKPMLVDFAIR